MKTLRLDDSDGNQKYVGTEIVINEVPIIIKTINSLSDAKTCVFEQFNRTVKKNYAEHL